MLGADTLFLNGTIHTLDSSQPRAEAMACAQGRVLALGGRAEIEALANPATRRVDMAGAFAVPGFNDAHVHVWKIGQMREFVCDVRGVASLEEMASRLREFANRSQALPAAWVLARGYNEARMSQGRHPDRHDLDAVLPDRPLLLIRTCAHIGVANSMALRCAGITADTPDPPGGVIVHDEAGQPTGLLQETALGLVQRAVPPPSREDYERMIVAGARHLARHGVTSATDPAVTPELLAAYRSLETRGALPIRMNLLAIRRPDGGHEIFPLPERHRSAFLSVEGVKFFADGGLSGATAALREPYRHVPTRGILRLEREEFLELARPAHRAGYVIGTHAIGDAAIEQVLGVYETLDREMGRRARHRIEHFGLPDASMLQRMARGGWCAVAQPIFLRELGANFRRYLSAELLERAYPLQSILRAGITLALSSDAPVVADDSPLGGMAAAQIRKDAEGVALAPHEALSAKEALRAYTMGGAIASGDEGNRGRLTPGMWADMALLSGDPLCTPPEEQSTLRVLGTWLGGASIR